jgi:hypothetical protein
MVLGRAVLTLGMRLTSLVLVALTATLDMQYTFWTFPLSMPWLSGARNGFILQLVDGAIFLLILVYIDARKCSDTRPQAGQVNRVTKLYLALCLVSVVSLIGARYPQLGIYELPILVKMVFVFFIVGNSVRSLDDSLLLIRILVMVMILQAGLGIYQSLSGNTLGLRVLGEQNELSGRAFTDVDVFRAVGTLRNGNALASFMILLLPSAMALAVVSRRRCDRVLGGVAFLGGVGSTLVSLGRSGLIVVFLVIPVTLWLLWRQPGSKKSYILAILILLCGLGLFLGVLTQFLVEHLGALQGTAPSVYFRIGLISGSVRLFFDKPLLGVGLANSALQMYWQANPSVPLPPRITPVHNSFLLWLAETGLVGAILFMLLLAVTVTPMVRQAWRDKDTQSLMVGAVAIGILGVIAHNQLVWTLRWSIPLQIDFWFLAGLGTALCYNRPMSALVKPENMASEDPG